MIDFDFQTFEQKQLLKETLTVFLVIQFWIHCLVGDFVSKVSFIVTNGEASKKKGLAILMYIEDAGRKMNQSNRINRRKETHWHLSVKKTTLLALLTKLDMRFERHEQNFGHREVSQAQHWLCLFSSVF